MTASGLTLASARNVRQFIEKGGVVVLGQVQRKRQADLERAGRIGLIVEAFASLGVRFRLDDLQVVVECHQPDDITRGLWLRDVFAPTVQYVWDYLVLKNINGGKIQ